LGSANSVAATPRIGEEAIDKLGSPHEQNQIAI
jgi:hypothetical protein